ncbi:hypothetical protein AKJ39_02760 [candidate division MSBL1 archaeon SCGC-AAA259J03]|uniref:Uncharacterized protein n=1 Tax=candidate division MSBL1 archaeon SCGC-AAA259J03 TaxID=1698269 RepID=A0A656YVZ8_9EURY|nr:hypothetical protein AKJ39_02760 [candidate division MSBL1 archaeon SCGC-AAA259J03]
MDDERLGGKLLPEDVISKSTRKISKGGEKLEVKVKERFEHEGDEFGEGEIVDLPGDTAERAIEKGFAEEPKEEKETSPIEPGRGTGETEEKREGIWSEMEESLDEEPELPARWNPSRDDVKSGEVSPDDVDDLFGTVKHLDVHRKYDTPMAVVETPRGDEMTVFQQKAIEDLFEEMQPGDLIAIRFLGLEKSSNGYEYLNYRYELRGPDDEKKLSR